jgi:hypothetical protein
MEIRINLKVYNVECNMDDYVTEVNIAAREDGSQSVYLISSYKPP